jgi:hypothetical protein
MNRKWIAFVLVFVLSIALVYMIDTRKSNKSERGIVANDKQKSISFVNHNDSLDHLELSFSENFTFSQKSYVRDKMLSGKNTIIVDEHILKTCLQLPDTDFSIDLRVTARFFDNADTLLFLRFFSEKGFDQELYFT